MDAVAVVGAIIAALLLFGAGYDAAHRPRESLRAPQCTVVYDI